MARRRVRVRELRRTRGCRVRLESLWGPRRRSLVVVAVALVPSGETRAQRIPGADHVHRSRPHGYSSRSTHRRSVGHPLVERGPGCRGGDMGRVHGHRVYIPKETSRRKEPSGAPLGRDRSRWPRSSEGAAHARGLRTRALSPLRAGWDVVGTPMDRWVGRKLVPRAAAHSGARQCSLGGCPRWYD